MEQVYVRTGDGAREFLDRVNGLHDGYIISVDYKHNGIEISDDGYDFYPDRTELKLSVLVTSIGDTIVEMTFSGVRDWRISNEFDEMLEAAIFFDNHGQVVWYDDAGCGYDYRSCGSYVVAKEMCWRIVEI